MRKLILLLFISSFSFSQTTSISENDFYSLKAKAINYFNHEKKDSLNFILNKFEQDQNKAISAYSFILKAFNYRNNLNEFEYSKNIKQAKKLISEAKNNNFTTLIKSNLYNVEGMYYSMKNDSDKSLLKYIEARDLALESKDYQTLTSIDCNIPVIYEIIGDYSKAIKTCKNNILTLEKYKDKLSKSEVDYKLCVNYANIGGFYDDYYLITKKMKHLDSSIYYMQKALLYEDKSLTNGININIGNSYFTKKDYKRALIYFLNVEKESKNQLDNYSTVLTNLIFTYFELKDYKNALKRCKSIDSLFETKKGNMLKQYCFSNYYQSRIYDIIGDDTKMKHHAKIYKLYNKQLKENLTDQKDRTNLLIDLMNKDDEFNKKIAKIDGDNTFLLRAGILAFFILTIIISYFYTKNKAKSKKYQFRINTNSEQIKEITIDTDQENLILQKIKEYEAQLFYLVPEFNQKELSKKIKTNTTYLSFVFNKYYNQSFNSYYNDLRINFAIEKMKSDKKYREYSTQAIGESVGFKNADSFTNSFKKKTGKTPFQFIKELKNNDL